MEKKKVQIRGGFSDRYGIKPLNTEMQVHDIDQRVRVMLVNSFRDWIYYIQNIYNGHDNIRIFYKVLIQDAFSEVFDFQKNTYYDMESFFKTYIINPILNNDYDEVFSLIEFLVKILPFFDFEYKREEKKKSIINKINEIFEKEYVGYRIIDNIITPITDEIELQAINECIKDIFTGCKEHINKALAYLSDRENPDYNNSVKESISAVESVCSVIVGKDKATLGDALNLLEKKEKLNGQLKSGFEKFYAYTNSADGIRHANGLFAENVTFEEAKFMLVTCCAFINYLKVKYANILSDRK